MRTSNIRVTKQFVFDMAHALHGYDGPCKNIHGHTYKLSVTIRGKIITNKHDPKHGMVLDFNHIKAVVKDSIIHTFDHALVLNNESPHRDLYPQLKEQFERIVLLDHQPTCENLLLSFKEILDEELQEKYDLVYLKLEETPTSFAEWLIEDN
jgi:6-pyruvoyltetrahydropterin/6-carboxytetrahydropterin synthase